MLGRTQVIVAAVVLALAFTAGWTINGWRLDGRHARVLEQIAQASVAAAQAARDEENRRIAAMEEERDNAQQQAQALDLDVAAGAAVADRLRSELARLRGRASSCTAAPANGSASQQGADPVGVLIDVLTRMESAGREVAEYADKLLISGIACEKTYVKIMTD